MGVAQLSKIPGVKMVANKVVGGVIDKLTAKIKQVVLKAVDGAIGKLRRVRRAGLFDAVKNFVGDAAGAAKAFAGNVARVGGQVAGAVQGVASKVNKLTGGKLSAALQSMVCPLIGKGVQAAITAALGSIGWPFGAPACLITAIVNGCKAAIKAGLKRHQLRMRLRRLAVPRKLAIPAWAKNALKASANTIIGTIIDCISQQVKSMGVAQLSKIPGVKMVANKVVGGVIDKLTAKIKQVVLKAVDGAIGKLRRVRRAGLFDAVKNFVGDAAGAAKAFAGNVARVGGQVAGAVQGVASKVNKLTGGKLSAALQSMVCPLIGKGVQAAITAALGSIGWPFGAPACLITAIVNSCKAAIKAGLKRHQLRLRRLAGEN